MPSATPAAVVLPAALLAWAAAAQPSASLRGRGPLPEAARNATRQRTEGPPPGNATLEAAGAKNGSRPQMKGPPPGNATLGAAGRRRRPPAKNASGPPSPTRFWHSWNEGGGKMWGHGPGIEVISPENVDYYDKGMRRTLKRCSGAECALIVNPPCCRTQNLFHIHFTHYQSYGANLKQRLESKVCGKRGWHGGGLPCHGKAAFFPGFPGVFSKAMTNGSIQHASVIAWPQSCGGKGTIVEVAYHCSIEHQIRGDFNANFR